MIVLLVLDPQTQEISVINLSLIPEPIKWQREKRKALSPRAGMS